MRLFSYFFLLLIPVFSQGMSDNIPPLVRSFLNYHMINEYLSKEIPGFSEMSIDDKVSAARYLERRKLGYFRQIFSYLFDSGNIKIYKESIINIESIKFQILNEDLDYIPLPIRQFHFPENKIEFKELREIDLQKSVLDIGGTWEEVVLLKKSVTSSICTINVLLEAKPNYIADIYNSDHMNRFTNMFKTAFARAVPIMEKKLFDAVKNISNCLNDEGVFIGNIIISSDIDLQYLADVFYQNDFKWIQVNRSNNDNIDIIATKNINYANDLSFMSEEQKNIYDYVKNK